MIQIKNNEATSTDGKWLRNKITGAVAKRQGCLPTMSADDFEELDERPAYTKEQYDEKVAELIRERYTASEEFALQRKMINASNTSAPLSDEKSLKAISEYDAYNLFVEECKERAKDPALYIDPTNPISE